MDSERRQLLAKTPKNQGLRTIPAAIVQALVASVQSVSIGLLLLPSDEKAFAVGAGACVAGWMLSIVVGQAMACAFSRLQCAVAGGAIETLPLMHAVASSVARDARGASDERTCGSSQRRR